MFQEIFIVLFALGIICYALGWAAVAKKEQRAQRINGTAREQYRRGITEGYQRGVLDAPELMDDMGAPE